MTPHKWADVIHAWADGEPLQWRMAGSDRWLDYEGDVPSFSNPHAEFRIKRTVTYRVALMQSNDLTWATTSNVHPDPTLEAQPEFVRWLTDRITVEV